MPTYLITIDYANLTLIVMGRVFRPLDVLGALFTLKLYF